jgi:hypothetical protein
MRNSMGIGRGGGYRVRYYWVRWLRERNKHVERENGFILSRLPWPLLLDNKTRATRSTTNTSEKRIRAEPPKLSHDKALINAAATVLLFVFPCNSSSDYSGIEFLFVLFVLFSISVGTSPVRACYPIFHRIKTFFFCLIQSWILSFDAVENCKPNFYFKKKDTVTHFVFICIFPNYLVSSIRMTLFNIEIKKWSNWF